MFLEQKAAKDRKAGVLWITFVGEFGGRWGFVGS